MSSKIRTRLINVARVLISMLFRMVPFLRWPIIDKLVRIRLLPQSIAHYFYAGAFSGKHLTFFNGLTEVSCTDLPDVSFLWKVKLLHYHGVKISDPDAIARMNALSIRNSSRWSRRFLPIAVANAIMHRDIPKLLDVLEGWEDSLLQVLGKLQIAGIYKILLGSGHFKNGDEISKLLNVTDDQLELAFLDIADVTRLKKLGWRDVFSILVKKQLVQHQADQLNLVAVQTEELVKTREDLFDLRSSSSQLARFHALLKKMTRCSKGYALIRLGDGEAYALYNANSPEEVANHKLRERHWWGKTLLISHRSRMAEEVKQAIIRADMIGVPSAYRFARDVLANGYDLGAERKTRDLITVLNWLDQERDNIAATAIVEDRVNIHGLSQQFIQELAEYSKNTIIVSCWTEEQLANYFPDNTEYVLIPGQMKTDATNNHSERLCDIYDSVAKVISDKSSPDSLVLVSAGIIGKIFVHHAAERGAVALDLGSTLDYFVGRLTRDPSDMI